VRRKELLTKAKMAQPTTHMPKITSHVVLGCVFTPMRSPLIPAIPE
jgi:hypothetical protein